MTGLSIIVASQGRPTLAATLASIQPQMRAGDELLVDVNEDAPWGHAARNRMMPRARVGNAVCFIDDDDVYVPGALDAIRAAFLAEPHRIHIFRMIYRPLGAGRYDVLWRYPKVELGNVSTQQFVIPSPTDARFSDRYEGDYDCLVAAVAQRPEPRWHERIVAHYRPTTPAHAQFNIERDHR